MVLINANVDTHTQVPMPTLNERDSMYFTWFRKKIHTQSFVRGSLITIYANVQKDANVQTLYFLAVTPQLESYNFCFFNILVII